MSTANRGLQSRAGSGQRNIGSFGETLRRPLPHDALQIVMRGKDKEDQAAAAWTGGATSGADSGNRSARSRRLVSVSVCSFSLRSSL
jgi:hypothetical protein